MNAMLTGGGPEFTPWRLIVGHNARWCTWLGVGGGNSYTRSPFFLNCDLFVMTPCSMQLALPAQPLGDSLAHVPVPFCLPLLISKAPLGHPCSWTFLCSIEMNEGMKQIGLFTEYHAISRE